MARKYGIVAASDVRVAAERGANFRTGGVNMGRKPYRPIMSPSPGFSPPGVEGIAGMLGRNKQSGTDRSRETERPSAEDGQGPRTIGANHPGDAVDPPHSGLRPSQVPPLQSGHRPTLPESPSWGGVVGSPQWTDRMRPIAMAGLSGASKPPTLASRMAKFAQGRGL